MTVCTRCTRSLKNPPVMVGGMPFGPTCAKAAKPGRDPLVADLFTGIDLTGAVLQANERVANVIDAAGARAMAEMREAWRVGA